MRSLKQWVPSWVCLSCEVCCRFESPASRWRPRLGENEQQLSAVYPAGKKGGLQIEPSGYLKTEKHGDGWHCVFFNRKDQTCGVYGNRPFECRLYPFLLVRQDGRRKLAVHLACPFIGCGGHSPELVAYVDYLKNYFQDAEVLRFLRENPRLFGDYSPENEQLEFMFDFPAE